MKIHYNKSRYNQVIISMICVILIFTMKVEVAWAANDNMPGYTNPKDIVIATPADNYSTKSSRISILGACDYRYPLYMNGKLIETTEYGFFTQYVELDIGENIFIFNNNGKEKVLSITRKKSSTTTSSGATDGSKVKYKKYQNSTYGVITSKYAMPRSSTSEADVNCMPLTRGTVTELLGEYGSYYKIADGSYVAKSSIKKYTKALENNKVTSAKMDVVEDRNQVVTLLKMNINALYEVYFEGNDVYLTLYHTISAKKPAIIDNPLIKSVSMQKDTKNKKITYRFELYDADKVLGYDVLFWNGTMKFELKHGPRLNQSGSLKGATVFLDAGHGKNDSGAVGPLGKYGPMEKDINLSIALYTKKYLEKLGATVVLSRETDTFYELSERVSMIRNLRPDISISIHGNSLDYATDYSKVSGFLTYYCYDIATGVPNMFNLGITSELGIPVRDERCRSLSLTRLTTCPALLLETSFLSNPSDYEYLIKEKNQEAFGKAIGKSVQNYLERVAITD